MVAEFFWQRSRRQHINRHSKKPLQFNLDGRHIHQRRLWSRVDEDIQIAVFRVLAVDNGAEDAGIFCAVCGHDAPDVGSVRLQNLRWFHFISLIQKQES